MIAALETDPGYVTNNDPVAVAEAWKRLGVTQEDIDRTKQRARESVQQDRARYPELYKDTEVKSA